MIWQEYDCPDAGFDVDLQDDAIVHEGHIFYCTACGGQHWQGAGVGPYQTHLSDTRGSMQHRGLPRDATERDAWIEEGRALGV